MAHLRDSCPLTARVPGRAPAARTRLAKSVHGAGWAALVRLLEQKAERYGRAVVKVGRCQWISMPDATIFSSVALSLNLNSSSSIHEYAIHRSYVR
jgi:transposase